MDAQEDGLTGVLLTDETYPKFAAFKLVRQGIIDFREQTVETKLSAETTRDFCLVAQNAMLQKLVQNCQDPIQLDKTIKIKEQIEDVKQIAVRFAKFILKTTFTSCKILIKFWREEKRLILSLTVQIS